MFLINQSKVLTDEDIIEMCYAYPFDILSRPDLEIVTDSNGVFGKSPFALLVTDNTPTQYMGLTYTFGAASVYNVADTMKRCGNLGRAVIKMRIVHEILHHFNINSDEIDRWFVEKNHPWLALIFHILGRSSGETFFGILVQSIYYDYLYKNVNETRFNEENDIEHRTYQGLVAEVLHEYSFLHD